MKTYGEICDEYAQEFGYKNYYGIPKDARLYHAERIAKRYATEAVKEHLSRAAENARIGLENDGLMDYHCVDKQSILDTPIELP